MGRNVAARTSPEKGTEMSSTAPETYATRRNDIARLIDVLQMELNKHDEYAKAENWCYAGDLAKVRSDLMDTVAFISGIEREHVEAFVADAI